MISMLNITCELKIKGIVQVVEIADQIATMRPKGSTQLYDEAVLWYAKDHTFVLSEKQADFILNTLHTTNYRRYKTIHSITKMLRDFFYKNIV